jgi:simple sugar transport system substrate-binding protein
MARTSIAHVLAVLVVALAACSRGGGAGETTETTPDAGPPRPTVALVIHQAPGDTFWDLVRRGAEAGTR